MEEQIKSNEEIPAMLKRIYGEEFTEKEVKFSSIIGETLGEISHDDQQFLKLIDQETIKVDGHYVVPLLLKSKDVNLPTNGVLALKRLNCLQRRFLKDIQDIYCRCDCKKKCKGKQTTIANQEKHATYHTIGLFIQQNHGKSV